MDCSLACWVQTMYNNVNDQTLGNEMKQLQQKVSSKSVLCQCMMGYGVNRSESRAG